MGLMINPAPTFTLNDGSVASEGKLHFYENGSTTIRKDVFLTPNLDPLQKLNNPLTLTDAGRLPTCFGTGTYTIVLESAAGVQQWVRNDVTIDDLTGQFADYSSVKTYKANEIVRYTDGNYYASQQNNNKGNVPSVNSEWWFQIAFLEFFNTAKAADEDYMENDIVIFNGFIYRSLEDDNGDTPPSAKWANLTFNDSVAGNFTVGGDLSVTGGSTVGANASVGGTLSVTGVATFADQINLTSAFAATEINLTGSGDFTSGSIKLRRIDDTVVINSNSVIGHASGTSAVSAVGVIPSSFRPTAEVSNVYYFDDSTGLIARCSVNPVGTFQIIYGNYSGGSSTTTSSQSALSLSFNA